MDPFAQDRVFCQIVARLKLAAPAQVDQALAEQNRLRVAAKNSASPAPVPRIDEILAKAGVISPEDVRRVRELIGIAPPAPSAPDTATIILPESDDAPAAATGGIAADATAVLGVPVIPTLDGPELSAESAPAFGRYKLLRFLGRGGMGRVWKAWDAELDRVIALKQILPGAFAEPEKLVRFVREARLAARLRHPGIVSVHDAGTIGDVPYITMDYVEGRMFTAVLDETRDAKRRGAPEGMRRLREEIGLLAEIAEAVDCAHREGVLHRDLKPSNVIVQSVPGGDPAAPALRAFVMDFGLAREFGGGSSATDTAGGRPLTVHGQLLGTPAYMSPEQTESDPEKIGPRSDVWALGVMLYEILAGAMPFHAENALDLLAAVAVLEPASPSKHNPHVPGELEAVCGKTMEKDPERRYRTAGEFARELRRWLAGEPVEARRLTAFGRLLRRLHRHRLLVWPPAVAALALLVAYGWSAQERMRADGRRHAFLQQVADTVGQFEDSVFKIQMNIEEKQNLAGQSLSILERWIKEDPNFGPAWSWRGKVQDLLGRSEAAERDYDQGCTLSPDYPAVWYLRGMHRIHRYVLTRTLPTPIFSDAGTDLAPMPGETPEESSRRERALEDLDRMVKAPAPDESFGEERRRLGQALAAIHSGLPEGFQMGLDLLAGGTKPRECWVKGLALLELNRPEEAYEAFSRALEGLPLDPEIRIRRGLAAATCGIHHLASGSPADEWFERSIRDYTETLTRWPELVRITLPRGNAYLALGHAQAARGDEPREAYRKALDDITASVRAFPDAHDLHDNLGVVYWSLGVADRDRGRDSRENFRSAIREFDEVLRANGEDGMVLRNRSAAYLTLGQAEHDVGVDPVDSLRHAIADAEEAGKRLHGLVDAHDACGAAWSKLAQVQAERGQDASESFGRAIAELDASVRDWPKRTTPYVGRGEAYLSLGQFERDCGRNPDDALSRAEKDFDAALRINPAMERARNNRGSAACELGRAKASRGQDPAEEYRRAQADLDEAIRLNPGGTLALLRRANVGQSRAEWEEKHGRDPGDHLRMALADLDALLQLSPQATEGRANRGIIFLKLGQREEARGSDPRPLYRKAVADYDRVLLGNPRYGGGLVNRSIIRDALALSERQLGGDAVPLYQESIRDLDEALKQNPESARAYEERGAAWANFASLELDRGGDPVASLQKSIGDCDESLRRRPGAAAVYRARAYALLLLGDAWADAARDPDDLFRRCLADYDAALKIDPELAEARFNRAFVLQRIGSREFAAGKDPRATLLRGIADLDEELRRKPSSLPECYRRGTIYRILADADAARGGDPVEDLNRAIADFSRILAEKAGLLNALAARGATYRSLAYLLQAMGKAAGATLQHALDDLNEVLRRVPAEAVSLNERGHVYRALARDAGSEENFRLAEADYRSAAALGLHEAWLNLGVLFRDAGRVVEALAAYESAVKADPSLAARAQASAGKIRRGRDWYAELGRAGEAIGAGNYVAAREHYEKVLALWDASLRDVPAEEKARRLADPIDRAALAATHYDLACIESLISSGRTGPGASASAVDPAERQKLRDSAFAHLDAAMSLGFRDLDHARKDPDLEAIRDDPRFAEILARPR